MKYLIVLYLVIPIVIMLLIFLSFDEIIPNDLECEDGIERLFSRAATYIYRRFLKNSRLFLKSPGRRRVRDSLQRLNNDTDIGKKVTSYYIKKISTMLILVFMGSALSLLAYISSGKSTSLTENGEIVRNDHGKGEKETRLTATDVYGEKLGEFDLKISEIEYTKEEADKLYKEMIEVLPTKMLQNNTDLDHVKSGLSLPQSIEGFPFEISWKSDNIDVLHSDGSVGNDYISFSGAKVMLTAEITYMKYEWEHTFDIRVIPRDFTEEEELYRELEGRLKESEEITRYKDRFPVPEDANGMAVLWKENRNDSSIMILLLSLVAAASIFLFGENDLTKQVEERKRQMILEYPAFVSRLVLYMGSGMSVRGIFLKFSDEYKKMVNEGRKRSFLYDEITKCSNELESGVPEISVYERLGVRCGSQQYARLVTLLAQNLKKGNSEMLNLLREESDKATMERMSNARKLGEEAGTKLLVPMVMMLFIVMVVIMVPAYLSF